MVQPPALPAGEWYFSQLQHAMSLGGSAHGVCGLLLDPLEQLRPAHPERGVVGTSKDAAHFFLGADDVVAEIAHGSPAAEDRAVVLLVHVDVAVGAVGRTETAADAVAFDLNLLAVRLAVDGIDRAADQAVGVGATAA